MGLGSEEADCRRRRARTYAPSGCSRSSPILMGDNGSESSRALLRAETMVDDFQSASDQALAARVASVSWYHSLSLPGGLITPGFFDTLDELERVPFPLSLDGKRCLDVATADGFWAFEMERRGA